MLTGDCKNTNCDLYISEFLRVRYIIFNSIKELYFEYNDGVFKYKV